MAAIHVRLACHTLREGGVIAYPTEAVWGLGCDPWNPQAFQRLLALKQRPPEKGVILVAASMAQIEPLWQDLSASQQQALAADWPGPFTWILPDQQDWVPSWIKGKHTKVAVRVSAHPLVQELCQAFGGPLVSTSANPSGRPPARSALRVRQYFGADLDGLVPGQLGGLARPTQIRDLTSGATLRA
ncbi:L-threonylcarbamoyladenylate synthase [Balneatrix alpica]|uniref:Threonylcarbamoyl-AMP synthase n=1 Tax=Balneatrix alpica TaxID=75684 RepID=A0ABV5ZA43_9GAMM|nr:Sua5/YciO/YrdC/YwlC family protein [Balneatrix alpica]